MSNSITLLDQLLVLLLSLLAILTLTTTTTTNHIFINAQAVQQEQQQLVQQEECAPCFSAIKTLHSNLDDDNDGEIDNDESENFIKEELALSNGIGSDRHRNFHLNGKDNSITLEELWQSWKRSQVHNWTVQDTIDWLINYVELPQYAQNFMDKSIDGSQLPRLAVAEPQFFTQLGITNPKDKHKIMLKSTDVVLFGPPKVPGYTRDIVVCVAILIATSFCYVTYSRLNQTQIRLKSLQSNLESLQKAEEQMSELQIELDRALKAQEEVASEKKNLEQQLEMHRQLSSSNLSLNHEQNTNSILSDGQDQQLAELEAELIKVNEELRVANRALTSRKWAPPPALHTYLNSTYQLESDYYNQKKLALESQALEVKQRNQKLQKKKTTFLGYYKMAQENSLEDDYNNIVVIKEEIKRITSEIKERTVRWRAIEDICGFTIM